MPYPLTIEMKLRNYIIGFTELGLDTTEAERRFGDFLTPRRVRKVKARALEDYVRHNLPLVSCICLTSARVPEEQHLIEEAIQSFLLQDYPDKELILLNDCPDQELVCDAPGVRVVNAIERFPTPADKFEAAMALAGGDLIATWDDNSISLPWRLSLSYQLLGTADSYTAPRGWNWQDGQISHDSQNLSTNVNHSIFRREALRRVGRLNSLAREEHQSIDSALRAAVDELRGAGPQPAGLSMHDWFSIHREDGHAGDGLTLGRGLKVGLDKQTCVPGRYVLKPHWRADYVGSVESGLRAQIRVAVLGDERPASGQRLPFARDDQRVGETAEQHLARVQERVAMTIARGGTHILIPRGRGLARRSPASRGLLRAGTRLHGRG